MTRIGWFWGLALAAAGSLNSSRSAAADASPDRAAGIREHLAYCRWKEAADACAAWKADLVKSKAPTEGPDSLVVRAREEPQDERLDFLYLTSFTKDENDKFWFWEVHFDSRPSSVAQCRINVYVRTESNVMRMTSRFATEASRGEHVLKFGFDKLWAVAHGQRPAEGKPQAARVELVYAGHAVDVMTEGGADAVDWWKAVPRGELLINGNPGDLNPESKSLKIVATTVGTWSLATVTSSVPTAGSTEPASMPAKDELPDETTAQKLSLPHAGYQAKWTSAKKRKVEAKPDGAAGPNLDDRIASLRLDVAYGPDNLAVERLTRFLKDAIEASRSDLMVEATRLKAQSETSFKEKWRTAFRIRRFDIQKLTPDTGGYWYSVVHFQATRAMAEPVRINVYALLQSGTLYGTYLTVGGVQGANFTEDYSYVFLIKDSDIKSGDKILKWRAEIGGRGVCYDEKESPGPAPDFWWLAPATVQHVTRDGRKFSSGAFTASDPGRIEEKTAAERLTVVANPAAK